VTDTPELTRDAVVSLREITEDTLWPVLKLSDTLSDTQKRMVAPNADSIAQAHFSK
jgi:diamine N-acetyltransferase